jgi:hypothetical protein
MRDQGDPALSDSQNGEAAVGFRKARALSVLYCKSKAIPVTGREGQ